MADVYAYIVAFEANELRLWWLSQILSATFHSWRTVCAHRALCCGVLCSSVLFCDCALSDSLSLAFFDRTDNEFVGISKRYRLLRPILVRLKSSSIDSRTAVTPVSRPADTALDPHSTLWCLRFGSRFATDVMISDKNNIWKNRVKLESSLNLKFDYTINKQIMRFERQTQIGEKRAQEVLRKYV